MKTSQEQILNALSGLIPEEAQTEVGNAISKFLESAYEELNAQFEAKLKEAYEEHQKELAEAEKIGEEGYGQALEIITELRDRLEIQKEEFEQFQNQEYEVAYQKLQEERAKNDTLEVELYEEYDKKFEDIKSYLVDKIDQFLQLQGEKYYEAARKDVMNDPAVLEHKLAFEKILEVTSDYISDEDFAFATSSKVENLQKQLDEAKGQMKILESKNMRLSMENNKLNETVKQSHNLINENVVKSDKKARVEKAKKAEGRGQIDGRQVVIGEYAGEPVAEQKSVNEDFAERVGKDVFADWKHLSGLTKADAE